MSWNEIDFYEALFKHASLFLKMVRNYQKKFLFLCDNVKITQKLKKLGFSNAREL